MTQDLLHTIEYWVGNKDGWHHVCEGVHKKEYGFRIGKYVNGEFESMRVLNKKYWPYQFFMKQRTNDRHEMERWCYDKLKSANWRSHGMVFAFKRMQDASYFTLIWS